MGERALSAEIVDGRLYGRGSCDDKASLAAMLYAAELLIPHRDRLAADVLILGSVGEEHLMNGIRAFAASGIPVAAAVVGEPTDLKVVVAHKGFVRFTLTTHGVAAHTSSPEQGDNAIYQMGEVLCFIRDRLTSRWPGVSHPLLGTPTLAVGRIWGGVAVNVVPDTCVVEIDRRTLPTESVDSIVADLDAALDEFRRAHPEVKLTRSEPMSQDFGLDTPPDSPIVAVARAACEAEQGWADVIGVRYGTNASTLAGVARIPSIVFGPGSISRAHTADEYVPLDEVEAAARIYARIALEWQHV
jgi:acetylornithine deacetylase